MVAELISMDKSDEILDEIKEMKQDLKDIKSKIDEDVFLSENDYKAIKKAEKEEEKGQTTSLEELKQELRL